MWLFFLSLKEMVTFFRILGLKLEEKFKSKGMREKWLNLKLFTMNKSQRSSIVSAIVL